MALPHTISGTSRSGDELGVRDVPTTVVSGLLGCGKTTAILDLFASRPADERWAILVNEFGEIGIDGAVLSAGGMQVKEVPGGCICCTSGMAMKIGLVRLLREYRPDRLLIEPSGMAHPAPILDMLRQPGIRDAVSPRALVVLVDAAKLGDPRLQSSALFHDQVAMADVLVANRCDLATADQLALFDTLAADAYPPKLAVAQTTHGKLDPAWLDLIGAPDRPTPVHAHDGHAESGGWIFPREHVFDLDTLERTLQELVRPNATLPEGVLRLKGVFRTRRGWLRVDAEPDAIRWTPISYRRDSRVDVIAASGDWDAVRARLEKARWRPGS